ncbi:MAG: hypothetical protein ACLTY5_06280 [Angelakisella sp.]
MKALPLYANTLAEVNPTYARRAQLENLLRQSQYERASTACAGMTAARAAACTSTRRFAARSTS